MTKQSKTLIALAAVVVVCAAGYVGLRTWNQSQSEVDETVYITQLSYPTALSVANQYGGFSFTKGEEGWTRDDDSDFPTDQDALDDLAGQAGTLAAVLPMSSFTWVPSSSAAPRTAATTTPRWMGATPSTPLPAPCPPPWIFR